jgi:serine/threonine protein kinase
MNKSVGRKKYEVTTMNAGVDMETLNWKVKEDFVDDIMDRGNIVNVYAQWYNQGKQGLNAMHDSRCMHGDIKAPNLMLFPKTTKNGKSISKLLVSDFGTATKIPRNKTLINPVLHPEFKNSKKRNVLNVNYGSVSYQPFKVSSFQNYDLYALALTMVQSVATVLGVGNPDIIANVETKEERVKLAKVVRKELRSEFKRGMEKNIGKIWTEILDAVILEKEISAEIIECEAQEIHRVAIEVESLKTSIKSEFLNLETDKKNRFQIL